MNRVRLDSPHACQVELERCSSGLAWLDHLYTQTVEALSATEQEWDGWEAQAAHARRRNALVRRTRELR